MSLCDSVEFDKEIFKDFAFDLLSTINDIISSDNVLTKIALSRQLYNKVEEFKTFLIDATLIALLCEIIVSNDLQEQFDEIENKVLEHLELIRELDSDLSNINADEGFSAIENAVQALFDQFQPFRDQLKEEIDNVIRVAFAPLVELGASENEINEVIDDAIFNDNIRDYIITIFNDLLDRQLQTVG